MNKFIALIALLMMFSFIGAVVMFWINVIVFILTKIMGA